MSTRRLFRYVRAWLGEPRSVGVERVPLRRDDREVEAYVFAPGRRPPFPGWILLHGLTRPGIDHAQLKRFARALSDTGAVVIVPEVPEWRDLRLDPSQALPTVQAAVAELRRRPSVRGDRYGLVGFSFGAPHAIAAARHPSVADSIAGITAFGGYADLERTLRFQLTGVHEWKGRRYRTDVVDPYGRWIIAANHLDDVPGCEEASDVTGALWRLAAAAGDRQVPADARWDPLKRDLRAGIARERRPLFDLFAPPHAEPVPAAAAEDMVERLAAAALRATPALDALRDPGRADHPLELIHGREDALIPFTESLRMHERLEAFGPSRVTVTSLFAHSDRATDAGIAPGDAFGFLRALRRVLAIG